MVMKLCPQTKEGGVDGEREKEGGSGQEGGRGSGTEGGSKREMAKQRAEICVEWLELVSVHSL